MPRYDLLCSFWSFVEVASLEATLAEHSRDDRPILYSEEQLEAAKTHDPLWNASQMQMVITGWMHNDLVSEALQFLQLTTRSQVG